MKQKIKYLLILLLLAGTALGQAPTSPVQLTTNTPFLEPSTGLHWNYNGATYGWWKALGVRDSTYYITPYYFNHNSATITGGPISSVPTVGYDPGTNISISTWISNVFYQTQAPTASLSGGTTYELGITAATHDLIFSYGRQAATATISTAVITPGPLNVYSTQPAQPGSVSGTQSVTTPSNTNRTYTLTVTTSDSKVATATTTDTWLPGRYWGRSASSTPDNTIILAVAGGNKSLSSSVAGTFTITASGSNYPFFAYPSSLAALTSIKDVNGFEVISAFNITTVSVTNVNGYTQNYRVYTLNAPTASSYTITTL